MGESLLPPLLQDYIKFEASDGKMRGMSDETRLAMEKWSRDNQ